MKIVMVCTGNICRSPMAEALMRSALQKRGLRDVEICSAGTFAMDGDWASDEAVSVMREYGLDIAGHRAQSVTRDLVKDALVLCMTRQHKRVVLNIAPDVNAHTLLEYAGEAGEVEDPYGRGIFAYRKAAQEIEEAVGKIAAAMV